MVALRNNYQQNIFNPLQKDAQIDIGSLANTTDLIYGLPNQGQIFSFCGGDVISEVVSGGSPLMQWIPGRGVLHKNEHVKHLSWVAPQGFDGSTSYMAFLAAQDPTPLCEWGPGTDFNVCEYTHTMHRITVSNKERPLIPEHFGMTQCEQEPQLRLRGPQQGLAIETDGDWAIARLGILLEGHMNWNLIYGDPVVESGIGMYDGLDNIIQTGWVADHQIGPGSCDFTDPLVINGTSIETSEDLLRLIKALVRKVRMRVRVRGGQISGDDMAIVMPTLHWQYIADSIACGALTGACTSSAMQLVDPGAWSRERARITNGGIGYGYIDIDGIPVPVIPEDTMGTNVTLTDGNPGTIGDIYILVKRFRGITILEHQYLDYNRLRTPQAMEEDVAFFQNGMIRAAWYDLNKRCYVYGLEMWGRVVSLMQSLQVKITDVTVESVLENENESGSFTSANFYAYGGNDGGAGVALIGGI